MKREEVLVLFDRYHNAVYRLALSYTRSPQDAEDIVQTVFLKLLETGRQPEPGREKAWLLKITANASRDLLRALRRRQWEPLDEGIPAFRQLEEGRLFAAVMDLPQPYRAAVYLHYFEGYTLEELARFFKVSPSAVSMRLHRARKLLEKELREGQDETAFPNNL